MTLRYFKYQFSASVQSKRWIKQRLIVLRAAAAVSGYCSESNINRGSLVLSFPDFSPSHFRDWINGVALLMAATIMKSLVNQWHHSSAYLAIASVCLSTAREPSSDCTIVMQILMWIGVNGASCWEIFIETKWKKSMPRKRERFWRNVMLRNTHVEYTNLNLISRHVFGIR